MSHRSKHRLVATVASLAIRHGVAAFATVAAACAIWTIIYVALLLWAILSTSGLGGPLAYPGGLLFVAVAAAAACILLFFPATLSAELICRSRALPILVQIPVSVAVLATLCSLTGITVRVAAAALPFGASLSSFIVWLFLLALLPIGFYWWIAQAGPLILSATNVFRLSRLHGG